MHGAKINNNLETSKENAQKSEGWRVRSAEGRLLPEGRKKSEESADAGRIWREKKNSEAVGGLRRKVSIWFFASTYLGSCGCPRKYFEAGWGASAEDAD